MGDSKGNLKYVVVGVTVIAVLGFGLMAIQSDEPPIKVRGGGLDIEVYGGANDAWLDGGNHWKLKSSGMNVNGLYNFDIVVGNYCTSSGTPPSAVEEAWIQVGESPAKRVQIKRHWSPTHFLKTKISPKGDFTSVPGKPRIVSNPNSGAVTIIVKQGYGTASEWSCTFPDGTFQQLFLYKNTKCP